MYLVEQLLKKNAYTTKPYRLIRLSSPNLNYILIIGIALVYMTGIVYIVPSFDLQTMPALCVVSIISFAIWC